MPVAVIFKNKHIEHLYESYNLQTQITLTVFNVEHPSYSLSVNKFQPLAL